MLLFLLFSFLYAESCVDFILSCKILPENILQKFGKKYLSCFLFPIVKIHSERGIILWEKITAFS